MKIRYRPKKGQQMKIVKAQKFIGAILLSILSACLKLFRRTCKMKIILFSIHFKDDFRTQAGLNGRKMAKEEKV